MAMYPCLSLPSLSFPSVSGAVCSFESQYAGFPLKSHSVAVTGYQSGSGTPSPSNPRALNGWSSANIAISDEDLYHDITVENGYLDIYGNVQASGLSSVTEYIPVVEGLVYYSYDYATANLGPRNICIYDDSKQFVSCITYETVNKKAYFTIPSTGAYIRITIDRKYIDQHLYNGTTATINFGSTIYGGNYDAVSGVLTVNKAMLTLDGSANWINVGGQHPQAFQLDTGITNAFQGSLATQKANNITNLYPWASDEAVQYGIRWQLDVQSGRLYVYDNNYSSDLAGFKQHLNDTPLQIAYLLNANVTTQLPPVRVETQLTNNVFADTGDTTLQYIKLG